MTWAITKRWVHPNNWDGTAENSQVRKAEVIINGISDGSDELADDILVDISGLQGMTGQECKKTSIEYMSWDITGLTTFQVDFDRSPKERIAVLSGQGNEDFSCNPLSDSGEEGDGTGDIIATSTGAAANDTFMLRLIFRVKE